MAEASQRTRTTVTTRVDSPVPKRRTNKKKKKAGISTAVAIIIILVVGWLVVNHNQQTVAKPVAVRSGR
jgi:hypothetical protein